jgi:hypothetical protein
VAVLRSDFRAIIATSVFPRKELYRVGLDRFRYGSEAGSQGYDRPEEKPACNVMISHEKLVQDMYVNQDVVVNHIQ